MNKLGLKPCPFCGREAETFNLQMERGRGATYIEVKCECGVKVEIDAYEYGGFSRRFIGGDALDIWNRRTAGGEDDETDRR